MEFLIFEEDGNINKEWHSASASALTSAEAERKVQLCHTTWYCYH